MKEIEGDETLPPTYPLNLSILSKLPIPASTLSTINQTVESYEANEHFLESRITFTY